MFEHYEIELYPYVPINFSDHTQDFYDAGAAITVADGDATNGLALQLTPNTYAPPLSDPAYVGSWQSGIIENRPPLIGDSSRTDLGWQISARIKATAGTLWQVSVVSTTSRNGTGNVEFTGTGSYEIINLAGVDNPLWRVIGLDVDGSFSSNVITRFQVQEVIAHDNAGKPLWFDWVELTALSQPLGAPAGSPILDTIHRAYQPDENTDS